MVGLRDRISAWFAVPRGRQPISSAYRLFPYMRASYFRFIGQTVVITPMIMGLASFVLFAAVPQMDEVYRGVLESQDWARGALGLAAIGLFSGLLYAWNWRNVTARIDLIYPDHADLRFDNRALKVRDSKTILIAALPFAGLFLGLLNLHYNIRSLNKEIGDISAQFGDGLPKASALKTQLSSLGHSAPVALLVTAIAALFCIGLLHIFRANRRRYLYLIGICYALSAATVLVPILRPAETLTAARAIGPVAGAGLVLIAGAILTRWLFSGLASVLYLLKAVPSGLLMLTPRAGAALIAVLVLAATASLSLDIMQNPDQGSVSSFAEFRKLKAQNGLLSNRLRNDFQKWLDERPVSGQHFPVFIVAAEGGGIYAASAAAFFLATLQDHCPQLARHIFAISAVSGGSIGASLFNASLKRGEPMGPGGDACDFAGTAREDAAPASMLARLSNVTLDDHITPVMAYLLPDLIHGLIHPSFNRSDAVIGAEELRWIGRDQILEQSFVRSFEDNHQGPKRDPLLDPIAKSWCANGNAPALLLNTTWVETGYRVAFSPFPLRPIGKGTLYSFEDLFNLEQETSRAVTPANASGCLGEETGDGLAAARGSVGPQLIEAAVVSARFPVIMPPKLYTPRTGKNKWTFVDGGYADSSGATTALELYNELKSYIQNSPQKNAVDLHLIVLTDALTEPDLKSIGASWYSDFISPLNTLLTVRRLLARRAIAQAYDQLGKDLIAIELDQKTFPLPLGWKISSTSSNIIRFMMGWPGLCPDTGPAAGPEASETAAPQEEWAASIARHNSCELQRIVSLLKPAPAVQPAAVEVPKEKEEPQPKEERTWRPVQQ